MVVINSKKIRYVELFSGIGAFTQAVKSLKDVEAECLFAADIDKNCVDVYKINYGIDSYCDLTKENIEDEIPPHDFCFFSPPCQAFSKSGKQLGFDDTRGTLINEVFKILEKHRPKYILMENVRNLVSHDNYNTMRVIKDTLTKIGYRLPKNPIILSPHSFGVPQTRDRAFVPGIYEPLNVNKPLEFHFGELMRKDENNIETIIDHSYDDDPKLKINSHEEKVLTVWNEFYQLLDKKVIGFPIWYEYFFNASATDDMPDWKKDFINKNKELYHTHKKKIDAWLVKYNYLEDFTPTQKKFEWQGGNSINSVWDGVIQFRPSGVRVKTPTTFPTLVAIVQIPIIGRLKRRLSVSECASLQSFSKDFIPAPSDQIAYKQFGNSINVTVLREVLTRLLNYKDE